MAEIISYPEKSTLSENDYLLISDSQNSYITKKTKVSDINALAPANTGIVGSGTTNYIPKFTSTKEIGNSIIYDSGTNIGIGINSPSQKLHVSGNVRVTGAYYDSTDSPGTSGHILSSTVSGTRWVSSLPGGPYLPLTGGTLSGNLSILKSQPSFSLIDSSSGSSISYIQNIGGNLYHAAGGSSVDNIFQSGSTQTMVIKGNGNVGIGTTNPTNRLHVENGSTRLDSKSATSLPLGLYSNFDNTGIAIFADDPIANSGQINVSNSSLSGNNEIGMNFATGGFSSANVKLSILNTGQLKAHSYGSGSFTGTATQKLAVDTNGNVIELPIGSGPVDGSGTANYTARWIDTDTLGVGALYDNGTNVGIGITSPARNLHVHASSGNAYLQLTQSSTGVTSNDGFQISMGASQVNFINRENGNMIFETNNSEKLRITSGGNVGIGTTSPSGPLHVKSSTSSNIVYIDTSANALGDNAYIRFNGNRAQVGWIDAAVTLTDAGGNKDIKLKVNNGSIFFMTSNTTRMFVNSSGNVGIGTNSPQAKLDISSTGTGDSMIIRNDDASSSAAPVLMLLRDSASATNGDYLGQIKFKGNSDTGAERVYAKITAKISDATNGAEDSLIETAVRDNGSNLIVSRQTNTDLKLINGTGLESDGDVYIPTVGKGLIIKSPDGTRYRITVDNSGNLGTELA